MKTCLTHPKYGYYTTNDPLGTSSRGDFVTSPEISQMFGEMFGIWFYTVFLAQKRPSSIQFVEFGPGKGTLMYDTLKAFVQLLKLQSNVSVTLIEASPILRAAQHKTLCGENPLCESSDGVGQYSKTVWGNEIRWLETEQDMEIHGYKETANYVICHEFFDALPIKQFEKTQDGWKECLVDYNLDSPEKFHLTIAPKKTTSSYLPRNSPRHNVLDVGSRVEISPETLTYAKKIKQIIAGGLPDTGAGLFVDYGPSSDIPTNTFRGIKDHRIVSPFELAGQVDLSADVDFQGIKDLMLSGADTVEVFGPVEQGDWLNSLGMAYRAEALVSQSKTVEEKKKIADSYLRLVGKGDGGMGTIYKFMAVLRPGAKVPVGFGGDVE